MHAAQDNKRVPERINQNNFVLLRAIASLIAYQMSYTRERT